MCEVQRHIYWSLPPAPGTGLRNPVGFPGARSPFHPHEVTLGGSWVAAVMEAGTLSSAPPSTGEGAGLGTEMCMVLRPTEEAPLPRRHGLLFPVGPSSHTHTRRVRPPSPRGRGPGTGAPVPRCVSLHQTVLCVLHLVLNERASTGRSSTELRELLQPSTWPRRGPGDLRPAAGGQEHGWWHGFVVGVGSHGSRGTDSWDWAAFCGV